MFEQAAWYFGKEHHRYYYSWLRGVQNIVPKLIKSVEPAPPWNIGMETLAHPSTNLSTKVDAKITMMETNTTQS